MALAQGAYLNHIARVSPDIERLAKFYHEVLGFEVIEKPGFSVGVLWLKLPSLLMHLIERKPAYMLPELPFSATSVVLNPEHLSRGHHIALTVSNFDSFVQGLKKKGIEFHRRPLQNGKSEQVFFFDPDGNGLEVTNFES